MKKHQLFFMGCLAAMICACSDEDSNYHFFNIPYPTTSTVYADQTDDSLNIQSTDSWTVTTDAPWLTLEYSEFDVPSGMFASKLVGTSFQPNTTGTPRGTYVVVKANGKTFHKSLVQVAWMNVQRPSAVYSGIANASGTWTNSDGVENLEADFSLTDSAHVTKDSIEFVLYAPSANITSNADWVSPETAQFTRAEGSKPTRNKAILNIEPNTTGTERNAVLTIESSNGVSTEIKLKQLK